VGTLALGAVCVVLLVGEKAMADEIGRGTEFGLEVVGEWVGLYVFLTVQALYNVVILRRLYEDSRVRDDGVGTMQTVRHDNRNLTDCFSRGKRGAVLKASRGRTRITIRPSQPASHQPPSDTADNTLSSPTGGNPLAIPKAAIGRAARTSWRWRASAVEPCRRFVLM
jgi:hypothetical protein